MKALALLLGLSLTCAACSAREPRQKYGPPFVKLQTPFDYLEHEQYARPGENGINGRAFVTQNGGVVTCTGTRVLLMPATSYFREMFWHMIVARSEPEPPEKAYPSLKGMIRRAACDEQGRFAFSAIPDGTWFLLTQVNGNPGKMLIAEIDLANGTIIEAVLTEKHIVGR